MRKGQASTEYLIILAVVIIVALIVVGVMGWFPGLSTEITEQQSASYWESATPFSIMEYSYSGTTLTLSLKNSGTDKLQLTQINGVNVNDTNFTAGSTQTVTATLPNCGSTGDSFTLDPMSFSYDNIGQSITGKTQTGTKPLVGKCD